MRTRLAAVGLMAVFVGATVVSSQTATQTKPPAKTTAAAPKAAPCALKTAQSALPATDEDKIASALCAAPASIAKGAAVVDVPSMKVLKPGTNGWTCMPDASAGGPMCLDKNGMDWAAAWMGHKDPPKDKMALGYMLMGASDASNTDPFATEPKPGEKWVATGPHLMVLNIGDHFDGYPTSATNTKVPYVMFAGTPYAHLMIPVK